ncbi:MAG: murein hydrolase activator EnvC family protein [Nitriliruptoraceae bacterium]
MIAAITAHRRRPLWMAAVVLVLAALFLEVPALAQSEQLERLERDLGEAEASQAELQERLDAATQAREELVAEVAVLEGERDRLERTVSELRTELDAVEELVGTRLRTVFKHGARIDPLVVFLASEDPTAALERVEVVKRAVDADRASTEALQATRTRVRAAEDQLAERQQQLAAAAERQEAVSAELQAAYAEMEDTVEDLQREADEERERLRREQERLEAERRARLEAERAARAQAGSSGASSAAPAPATSGGMACPLDQPRSFIDSWGFARSGGRSHRGTDIMGPLGIPVRAITSGTWQVMPPGASAGLWGILRGDDGHHYWYLHLDSHTVASGARVRAGQQVGTNGSTGNAVAGAEHVHFEYHVGGSQPVNPYRLLRGVCG